jgi:AAT family amino acid transporter
MPSSLAHEYCTPLHSLFPDMWSLPDSSLFHKFISTHLLNLICRLPRRLAPAFFARTTSRGVPIYALLATASISLLCIASSRVGSGELWGWLQNLVGVSNQIAWLSIGIASWRFRGAWKKQGRPLQEMVFRSKWTWGWGAPFFVIATTALILSMLLSSLREYNVANDVPVQGWGSFAPFVAVDFVSLYIELPLMAVFATGYWLVVGRHLKTAPRLDQEHRHVDEKTGDDKDAATMVNSTYEGATTTRSRWSSDIVDQRTVDLYQDEHTPTEEDLEGVDSEALREKRKSGKLGFLWRLYYIVA